MLPIQNPKEGNKFSDMRTSNVLLILSITSLHIHCQSNNGNTVVNLIKCTLDFQTQMREICLVQGHILHFSCPSTCSLKSEKKYESIFMGMS